MQDDFDYEDAPDLATTFSQPSIPSSFQPAAAPAQLPSLESLHAYLKSEKQHPFPPRRGTSSFVLVHNRLSWRPSPHIMTILVDFFPTATPWAYAVSTPGARLFTEHSMQGLRREGYAVQPRTTYNWLSSHADEDTKNAVGHSGGIAEDDRAEDPRAAHGGGLDSIPVYPLELGGGVSDAQRRGTTATTHTYPSAGFVPKQTLRQQSVSVRHKLSGHGRVARNEPYECINMKPELSLCVSVTCTSRDALQQTLLSSWWLSRYFGVSLTLEGMKQDGLAVFKELQEKLFIKELRLLHGAFSESWLQAISMCPELISLTAQECTAESADIQLQYVNSILSSRQTPEMRRSPPPPQTPATSNWYLNGSRSLGLLLKLKCLHLINTPVTEGFVDNLVSSPALECCVFDRVKRIKSLQSLASLRALRSLVVVGSTITTDAIAPIRDCPALTSFTLERCQFVDDYNFLTGLSRTLERLSLSNNWLTDAQLGSILACTQLRELHLRSQKNVTDVSALAQLPRLEVLDMSENFILTDGVLHLTDRSNLQRLAMESLRCLRTWRRVFEAVQYTSVLVSLTVRGNDHIEDVEFSSLSVCTQLRVLDVAGCGRLRTVEFLHTMSHTLRWLNLATTAVTDASLAPVATCRALRLLNLCDCVGVTCLPFAEVVNTLEFLYLARTPLTDAALQTVCVFCPMLRLLDLQSCALLRQLSGVSRLRYLRELDVAHTKIRDKALFQLRGSRSLEILNVSHCARLSTLVDLSGVRSLKSVRAESLSGMGAVLPMNWTPHAACLSVSAATPTATAAPTAIAQSEEHVSRVSISSSTLSSTSRHGSLSMLLTLSLRRGAWTDASLSLLFAATSSLTILNLSECSELRFLTGLEQLATSLTQLSVRHTNITNAALESISACVALEVLDVAECPDVTNLNPLGSLVHLTALDASETQVTNAGLAKLAACQKLSVLSLAKCRYVSNINVLGSLARLVELNVESTAVTYDGTRQLVRCVSLKRVNFSRCTTLVNSALLGSAAPKQLETLDVYGTLIPTRGVGQPQQHACVLM